MRRPSVSVCAHTSVAADAPLGGIYLQWDFERFPVVSGGDVVGVLNGVFSNAELTATPVKEVLQYQVQTLPTVDRPIVVACRDRDIGHTVLETRSLFRTWGTIIETRVIVEGGELP